MLLTIWIVLVVVVAMMLVVRRTVIVVISCGAIATVLMVKFAISIGVVTATRARCGRWMFEVEVGIILKKC